MANDEQIVVTFYLPEQAARQNIGLKVISSRDGSTLHSIYARQKNVYYDLPRASTTRNAVAVIEVDAQRDRYALVIWDIDGNTLTEVFDTTAEITQVVWQDANTLLFSSNDPAHAGIYQLNLNTRQTHLIYSATVKSFDYHSGKDMLITSEGDLNMEIFVMDLESGLTQNLTSTTSVEASPYVSRNGQWISYLSNQQGHLNLYVKQLDSGKETRITNLNQGKILSYFWSKDENRLLVNLASDDKITAIVYDPHTHKKLKTYQDIIFSSFGSNNQAIYVAKKNGNQIEISTNQQLKFTLPQQPSLYRFLVIDQTLYYQSALLGPVLAINEKGVKSTPNLPDSIVHWFIDDSGKMIFTFVPTIAQNGSFSGSQVAQLDLNLPDPAYQLIKAKVSYTTEFFYASQTNRLYYSGYLEGDKATLYLLERE